MKIVIYGKLMCQACENAKRELTKRVLVMNVKNVQCVNKELRDESNNLW